MKDKLTAALIVNSWGDYKDKKQELKNVTPKEEMPKIEYEERGDDDCKIIP